MKSLFCTDGSAISYNSLLNFAKFVNKDAVIDTICVIDWSFLPDDIVIEESGFAGQCQNVADTILEKTKDVIISAGMQNGNLIKRCGSVVETILDQVENNNYEFIILGTHGKKGFERWLGSVSKEIFSACNNSIFISKEKADSKKILFATDGTDFAYNIINDALMKLDLCDAEIYICSVVENPELLFLDGTLDSNWFMAIQTQQEIYSEKAILRVKKLIENYNLDIAETKVITDTPAHGIIEYAHEKKIDLIVLGTKNKSKMRSFLLDSVSKKVVEHVNCATLVIKKS